MTYDRQSDRIAFFGGGGRTSTYDYNSNVWRDMQPAASPPDRSGYRMASDAGSDRVILFGGYVSFNDTLAYDYETNTWSKMNPGVAPLGRHYHSMAYDAKLDRVILFGGHNGICCNDTWAYDYDPDTCVE